jgi:hypothetical protein
MNTLYYNGRVVAVNRDGKWTPVGEVPLLEQGAAFKHGEVVSDFQAPEKHNPAAAAWILISSILFLVLFISKLSGAW